MNPASCTFTERICRGPPSDSSSKEPARRMCAASVSLSARLSFEISRLPSNSSTKSYWKTKKHNNANILFSPRFSLKFQLWQSNHCALWDLEVMLSMSSFCHPAQYLDSPEGPRPGKDSSAGQCDNRVVFFGLLLALLGSAVRTHLTREHGDRKVSHRRATFGQSAFSSLPSVEHTSNRSQTSDPLQWRSKFS